MKKVLPNFYHGPSLVRFLEEEGLADKVPDGSLRRTFRHWRGGHNPTEATVDRFCVETDLLHLRDIPAWVIVGWPKASIEGLEIKWLVDGGRVLVRAE